MGTEFNAVYSSDLARASETTAIICHELGIEEIFFDKRLREGNAGIFTGRCVYDLTTEENALPTKRKSIRIVKTLKGLIYYWHLVYGKVWSHFS